MDGATIQTNTKVIEDIENVSFYRIFAKNNQLFSLSYSLGAKLDPIKWMRFKDWTTSDYYYMSCNYWDAVIFIPKRDIEFCGFGLWVNYHRKDIKLKVKWALGNDGADF